MDGPEIASDLPWRFEIGKLQKHLARLEEEVKRLRGLNREIIKLLAIVSEHSFTQVEATMQLRVVQATEQRVAPDDPDDAPTINDLPDIDDEDHHPDDD